jgi:predicted nucleic acid-binding protein
MDSFVLDVSACMPWCCQDEATSSSEETLTWAIDGAEINVPSLWPWEIMNAVAVAIRRGRVPETRASEFFSQMSAFNIRIAPSPRLAEFGRLVVLAGRFQLTAYDAAYLDLAIRLALPLATLDDDLRRAALLQGVIVV